MKPSPKILIVRLSSLGDILHALPAFAGLRVSFPNAQIDWLAGPNARSLLTTVPGIDAIHVLDTNGIRSAPTDWSAWRQLWNVLRKLRVQHYDYLFDFQGLLKTAFVGFLSGAAVRLGFSRDLVREPPAHWFYHRTLSKPPRQLHVLELNQRLTEMIGARSVASTPNLVASKEDVHYVDSLLEKQQLREFVVINPGGGWQVKRWSPERYGSLAAKIETELDIRVVVTTGPGEEELFEKIAAHSGQTSFRHLQISFLQLIHLLRKAHLFIGGDTGPFHLACALGTAVVGIFGPTSPVRNGPWRNGEEIVTHKLLCSYCHKRTCPTDIECMDIAVDEVFDAVVRRLKNRERSKDCASDTQRT